MTVTGVLRKAADAGADRLGQARHAGLLLAVLLLAGCPGTTGAPGAGFPDPATANRVLQAPMPKAKPAPRPVVPAAAPAAPAVPAAPADPLVAALPPPVPADIPAITVPPPATPNADPDSLVGLDEVQTLHLLGSPVAREEAPPAKVWRYAKGDCTLKVFFFMDMTASQDFRALSYDMKSSPNVPDADHRCFAQLLAQAGSAGR